MGRGTYRNIITGKTSCPKTFLCRSIELLFNIFRTPSNNKYVWMDFDGKELIFLNDFWWWSELILWVTFLVLLVGEVIHCSLPKNLFSKHLLSLPPQDWGLSTLMILFRARRLILDGRYLSFPIKYCQLSKRIWHHVANAFVIWLKEIWVFDALTYFIWFFSDLIYFIATLFTNLIYFIYFITTLFTDLTYSWLKQAALAYSFTSGNIIALTEAKTRLWILHVILSFKHLCLQKYI